MKTIADILQKEKPSQAYESPAPAYTGDKDTPKILFACRLMEGHTTSEGWQMQLGLQNAGFVPVGGRYGSNLLDTQTILDRLNPGVVVVQDKREWEGLTAGYEKKDSTWMKFRNIEALKDRDDILKLTVLKDAHNSPAYHQKSADEMGVHGWICYYEPLIVKHLSGFVRKKHLIRTTHCVNKSQVPEFVPGEKRFGALLSGALNPKYYPLRAKLRDHRHSMPGLVYLPHPGYGHSRCTTPTYLNNLSRYKVAVCTCSRLGYFLRKIIEATCCGCRVVTDLPVDIKHPIVEDNLIRVDTYKEVRKILSNLYDTYDNQRQYELAEACKEHYDYRQVGKRLSSDIEKFRQNYNHHSS
jgi:hypothetical protein